MSIKRVLSLLFATVLVFSLCACSNNGTTSGEDPINTTVGDSGDVVDTNTTLDPDSSNVDSGSTNTNNGNSTTNSNNKTQGADNKVPQKPITGNPDSQESDGIKTSVTIKKGTTRIEQGQNFGGKTFKYALGISITDSEQRMLAKFQKQYNCKIDTSLFGFETYVQDLAAKKAAGEVYDILQVEGIRFPSISIANLVMPLENVITTADWYNASAAANGGFNQELTNNFVWNNHLYAVVPQSGRFSPQMMVLFYNKKIIKEAGLKDPRTLYEQGKWDWDAFYKLGTDLVKNGVFLADRRTINYAVNWNDAETVDTSDPAHPKANLADSKHINAFKFIQKLTLGQGKVVDVNMAGDDGTPNNFLQGKTAMWCGFYFDLYENYILGDGVTASNYFGKNINNLGIVPGPFGPDNKDKAHTVGSYIYGIGVGEGSSNPNVAMTYAKFSATYKSTVKEKYNYSATDLSLIKTMSEGPLNYTASSYADGSNTLVGLRNIVYKMVALGEDIAQTVNSYNARLQNCIDVTIKQQ